MFKKFILTIALFTSFSSMASLITNTQTQTYAGTAGDFSDGIIINPFEFEKFDSSLGTLLNINVWYGMTVDNGIIGADNKTNSAEILTGELGAVLTMSSVLNFLTPIFQPIFAPLSVAQDVVFSLAADPTLTTGPGGGTDGSGDDVQQFDGALVSADSGWKNVNNLFFEQFVGTASETFDVDFVTESKTVVEVGGAQGFFEVVDALVTMQLFYEYEPNAPVAEIPEPKVFSAGLLLLGVILRFRSIKQKSTSK